MLQGDVFAGRCVLLSLMRRGVFFTLDIEEPPMTVLNLMIGFVSSCLVLFDVLLDDACALRVVRRFGEISLDFCGVKSVTLVPSDKVTL